MDKVKIVEVSPRDGLQNEKNLLPTPVKVQFIQKLIQAGVQHIEATSFVSPKYVPQLADHMALIPQLSQFSSTLFSALLVNEQGLNNALLSKVRHIALVASASETFSQKNMNQSIDESLKHYTKMIQKAKQANCSVRAYVSCVLGCPYEGKIEAKQVAHIASALFSAGSDEIALGDTIGVGTAYQAKKMLETVSKEIPIANLAVHFHDTYGQALANILTCLELGVRTIDSSVAGLGGCPFAQGASGNVATEDLIYMLHGLGLDTGIQINELVEAGAFICQQLKHEIRSKAALAIIAKKKK